MGAPYSPGVQSLGPKRSSSRVEKRIEAGCWPAAARSPRNGCRGQRRGARRLLVHVDHQQRRVERAEAKLLAVIPNGRPRIEAGDDGDSGGEAASASRSVRGFRSGAVLVVVSCGIWRELYRPCPLTQSPALLGARGEDFLDRRFDRLGHQIERRNTSISVGGADRARDREGQPLDAVALEAEMRLPKLEASPAPRIFTSPLRAQGRTRRCASRCGDPSPSPAAIVLHEAAKHASISPRTRDRRASGWWPNNSGNIGLLEIVELGRAYG